MFTKIVLDISDNLFSTLLSSTQFEHICNGRLGATLVKLVKLVNNDLVQLIPLVRTTTKYNVPPQEFKPIHYQIIDKIKECVTNIEFNNALIEVYNNQYTTMGFHSDQALDLEKDSYIAIYSCYENPLEIDNNNCRKLIIKNKLTNNIIEIVMEHNSVILFNLNTNKEHLHKIITTNNITNNNLITNHKWLGITFRLSKTFVHHIDNIPHIYDNILKLANDQETKEFYKLRGLENKNIDFEYPDIYYTISESDLLSTIEYQS